MANDSKFTPRMHVYVIMRDEDGNATEIGGYVFLAHVEGVVILTSYINDYDFDGILAYHVQCTAEDYETNLCVFPDEDCYCSYDDCKADFEKENVVPSGVSLEECPFETE